MEENASTSRSRDHDRERYLRWQEFAMVQLGYTVNMMLTLAGAALALAAKTMMESKSQLPYTGRPLFHTSVAALAISIFVAVAANFTRACDFRYTRRAARARMKDGQNHDDLHDTAEKLGKWTWYFFYVQAPTFALGVIAFALSIWCGYGNRI